MKTYISTVLSNKKFADNNFLIELKKPASFNFQAGQFVMLFHKNEKRAFSIASAPSEKTLRFLIKKHEPGAVSPFLFNSKKGGKVKFEGPYGTFLVREPKKEIIFIAAGTGVAPCISMLFDSLGTFLNIKITLLFGFREDFFFEKEILALKKKHKNFNLVTCSSKQTGEHITDHIEKTIKNSEGKDAYVCGPPPMVNDTIKILKKIRFRQEQIHYERWD